MAHKFIKNFNFENNLVIKIYECNERYDYFEVHEKGKKKYLGGGTVKKGFTKEELLINVKERRNQFLNVERNRHYGLRVGDIVSPKMPNGQEWHKGKCEVIELSIGDNNKVYVQSEDGTKISWVAEWCDIITKVEDRVVTSN